MGTTTVVSGTFNSENKPTFNELAPSLQNILNNMTSVTAINAVSTRVDALTAQLGSNRVSITPNLGNVNAPKNGRELAVNTSNYIPYSYQNGWSPMGGVYS